MKIRLVVVGGKMPQWVESGYAEYAKRLPKDIQPQLVELPVAKRSKTHTAEFVKNQEAKAILATLGSAERVIALDVKGKSISTEALASTLENWQMAGQDISILIGGPEGLASECLQRADERWSLSALTLPHPLVRVLIIEQLYRAWSITQNHPYHK